LLLFFLDLFFAQSQQQQQQPAERYSVSFSLYDYIYHPSSSSMSIKQTIGASEKERNRQKPLFSL
jgi:hypothetical protein